MVLVINRIKLRISDKYLPVARQKYYYIIAVIDGRRFIASVPGKFRDMMEARRAASALAQRSDELKHVPWDVIESRYSDINHVMATLRHPIWQSTGSIKEASQRMRHKLKE